MPAPASLLLLAAMFRIKICGLTHPDDLPGLLTAGVEAIGLNFYGPSKRFVEDTRAAELAAAVPAHVALVGVFVNAAPARIAELVSRLRLRYVQLHGDETIDDVVRVRRALPADVGVIRALPLRDDPRQDIEPYLNACAAADANLAAVLVDAHAPTVYGGTGRTVDWDALARWTPRPDVPLILAGGLTPENVAAAIASTGCAAVDTAGGVECLPGRKDPVRSLAFVRAARKAFAPPSATR